MEKRPDVSIASHGFHSSSSMKQRTGRGFLEKVLARVAEAFDFFNHGKPATEVREWKSRLGLQVEKLAMESSLVWRAVPDERRRQHCHAPVRRSKYGQSFVTKFGCGGVGILRRCPISSGEERL